MSMSILSNPIEWAQDNNLLRPLGAFICGLLFLHLRSIIYKGKLSLQGVLYFFLCHDKSWKKPCDPDSLVGPFVESGGKLQKKTIYFVRHGESTWNDTFNKGKHRSALLFAVGFIPGLFKALSYEIYLLLTGQIDSWFYDSPLSYLGLSQIDDLAIFLSKKSSTDEKHLAILNADPGAPSSVILCSNLRRAISTLAAGFRDRLARRPDDKILIVPSLQEISRNPDTLSITPAHTQVNASWVDKSSKMCDFQDIFTHNVDASLHTGNKPLDTNGLKRMTEFCEFCFSNKAKQDHLIVGGHSIYFRSFFKTFLPYTMDHAAKKKKIVNAGVVAFTLLKAPTPNGVIYMIDPNSIHVVYGGFD